MDNMDVPGGHEVQDSYDMDNMDMDDMFDDDMMAGMDSGDDEKGQGDGPEIEMGPMGDDLDYGDYGDESDHYDSPRSRPKSGKQIALMGLDAPIDIADVDMLGVDEEKDGYDSGNNSENGDQLQMQDEEKTLGLDVQDPKVMNVLDSLVKNMLDPDIFKIQKKPPDEKKVPVKKRLRALEKKIPVDDEAAKLRVAYSQMTKKQKKREIVMVADKICEIDRVEIYDKEWFKDREANQHKETREIMKQYIYTKVDDLKDLPKLYEKNPNGFFGDTNTSRDSNNSGASSQLNGANSEDGDEVANGDDGEEYLRTRNKRTNTFGDLSSGLTSGVGAVGGGLTSGIGALGKGVGGGLGQMGGAFGFGGNEDAVKVVCSACGNPLKFKPKKGNKPSKAENYIGYICKFKDSHDEEQENELIFHDYLCVKLRKIKEAIKEYVLQEEREDNKDIELDNALIKIDQTGNEKSNKKMRPKRKTTPKKGDFDYKYEAKKGREDSADSSRYSSEGTDLDDIDELDMMEYGDEEEQSRTMTMTSKRYEKTEIDQHVKTFGYQIAAGVNLQDVPKDVAFRKYRAHARRMLERLEPSKDKHKQKDKAQTYAERFGKLPEVLLYCDLSEFGEAVFLFVSDSMKSKTRRPLWDILQWLALEMPTTKVLELLQSETHLLNGHDLPFYDKVCKATMEGAKFPIACTLKMAAFMKQRAMSDLSNKQKFTEKSKQYVDVSRRLLKEIESDHLFGMLLMLPTDIDQLNVIEIALESELVHFLEDPRIVRVFSVLWFHGYDFLDPSKPVHEPHINAASIFDKVGKTPGRFYWSPFGQFVITTLLYAIFLGLFCWVTTLQIYDYKDTPMMYPMEAVMWVFAVGYVAYEVVEFASDPGEYFSQMSNLFDVFISINWMILLFIRFVSGFTLISQWERILDNSGTEDYAAERQTTKTIVFMFCWGLQCILMWVRVINIFQIHPQTGPLIKMIIQMVTDIKNWGLVVILFLAGGAFAVFYIAAGDADPESDLGNGNLSGVIFYMIQTLLGQQDWDAVGTYTDDDGNTSLDSTRSSILQSLIVLYSIIGNILLLNLLIAMMAATFDRVKKQANQQLNFSKIETYYDLDSSECTIAPPFNVLAYAVTVYVFGFEMIAWLCTFGQRQWNEEYLSPLNRKKRQYSKGDRITFRQGNKKLKGICTFRTPKALRPVVLKSRAAKEKDDPDAAKHDAVKRMETEMFFSYDLQVKHRDTVYDLKEDDIVKVKKNLFKRREHRLPSLDSEKMFCRYCRYDLTEDRMPIEQYLAMFEKLGEHIDPQDADYMQSLISPVDESGIPTPLLCSLCPNCYRPFREDQEGPDVMDRAAYLLEIVSFAVFKYTLRIILLIMFFLPKLVTDIIRPAIETVVLKVASLVIGDINSQSKSIMNTSEDNENFRLKVRQVSQSEEKQDQIVRRIDKSVKRLRNTLTGDWEKEEGDELLEKKRVQERADRFEKQISDMEGQLLEKFAQIEKLLAV